MFFRKFLSDFWRSKPRNTVIPEEKVDEIHNDSIKIAPKNKLEKIRDDSAEIVTFMVKELEPCDSLEHCIVTWNKSYTTFHLYQNLKPSSMEKGKLLLAARRFKHPSHMEYVISLDADDFSKESNSYVGKLSLDYLGVDFTIYENRSQYDGAVANNFKVGRICYEFDEKSEGGRSFVHSIRCPSGVDNKKTKALRNATLKWHEDLQCLCFEIKFKVNYWTYPDKHSWEKIDKENILMESSWFEDGANVLVYRHPCSALQAFANCISRFRTYKNGTFYV